MPLSDSWTPTVSLARFDRRTGARSHAVDHLMTCSVQVAVHRQWLPGGLDGQARSGQVPYDGRTLQ
jgi:hypothetical protein